MQSNSQNVHFYDFQSLPMINSLDQHLLSQLDALMMPGASWIQSFQGLTALRSINKFYPQCIIDALGRYMSKIVDLINNGKTQIVKNAFALIKQVFRIGKQVNVQKCVFGFAGLLIRKSAVELGKMKQMASQVLVEFVNNCGYDISFVIVSQYCCDKNSSISQISIRMLGKLIQNTGMQITQLKPETLQSIMKSLVFLLDGKRQNVKNWAKQICMFIYNLIGNQNYLSLMGFVLNKQQMEVMIIQMQTNKKMSKLKQTVPSLASVLKQRKSMIKMNNSNNNQQFNYNNNNQNLNYQNTNNNPFTNNSTLLNTNLRW